MLASKERLADMKERSECLELMEFFLKRGFVEEAKEFGKLSQYYAERIKKDNYQELDKKWEIYHLIQTI